MHDLEIHKSIELYPGQVKVSCHSCAKAIIRRPWETSFVWRGRKAIFITVHQPNKANGADGQSGALPQGELLSE